MSAHGNGARNSALADEPRDAFVQVQWGDWWLVTQRFWWNKNKQRSAWKNDSSHPAFQGHSRSLKPTRIDPPSMISYLCFLSTLFQEGPAWDGRVLDPTYRLTYNDQNWYIEILDFKNAVTFKTGLGVRQCHWKCPPFDWANMTFYWRSIVTMALSPVVSEIFNVEKCRDLEIRVRGHSRSSKVVPSNDTPCIVSY